MPPSKTLRHYYGSPFGSSNRCISDFTIASSKFLALLGTSDMPETLGEAAATISHSGFINGRDKTIECDMKTRETPPKSKRRGGIMKNRMTTMMVALLAIALLVSNIGKLKAQVPEMLSPELMEFFTEWAVLSHIGVYIPALLAYNDMLYEGKKVTAKECVEFDEAIGTIANVMKKAWAGIKDATIRKEMLLASDAYINASKLYADYHKTGKMELKEKADKLLDSAGEHWEKVGKYIESKFGGGM